MKRILVYTINLSFLLVFFGCTGKRTDAPILLLATNHGFGTYTEEILKTEGFRGIEVDSLNSKKVTVTYLSKFNLVILTESKIDQKKKRMVREFVERGGNLIAFRPDPELAGLFGLKPKLRTISEGYIRVDPSTEQGKGIISNALQFHGTADIYTLGEGKDIAALFSDRRPVEGYPGVVSNSCKKGQAIAFLYNLPQSIVYTRQGNPEFAGIEKDGIPGLRSLDLFAEGWVDTSNNTINQADQQMALLSNCIRYMTGHTKPLPRLWYFPDTLKCLVTLTNDGEYRAEADFEPQFRDMDSMGAKMSLYILETDKVTKEWADQWTSRGFEIAAHPDDTEEAGHPGWDSMDLVLKDKKKEIETRFGVQVRTVVNHWFVWCGTDSTGTQDFGAQAMLEEKNGIELDINYPLYDINSNQGAFYLGTPGINQGFHAGSGLVMKFANAGGKTINVYQHFNAVYDQQYMESNNPEGFFNCFKGMVDRSLNDEIYSFVSIKSHNDEYYFSKKPLMKMLTYANSKGLPVWTAENLLDFVKMRDEATFSNISWINNKLSFILNSALKHSSGLTCMIPASYGGKMIKRIKVNGEDLPAHIKLVKGSEYAFVTVEPGKIHEISADYTQ
ncbi:MAG: hypothetical protein V2B15_11040 [Bacteroidota bacterium]